MPGTVLPIDTGAAQLRTWQPSDLADLIAEADNRAIARNLTDRFPSPYTAEDGRAWLEHCLEQDPPRNLVIAVNARLAGVCGFVAQEGIEAGTGLIGYWLGESYWGRGIGSSVVRAFLRYVWATFPVDRLEARVFGWNPASARILASNGFTLEGTRRDAIRRYGELTDELIYGLLRSEVV